MAGSTQRRLQDEDRLSTVEVSVPPHHGLGTLPYQPIRGRNHGREGPGGRHAPVATLAKELLAAAADGHDQAVANLLRDLELYHKIEARDARLLGQSKNTAMHMAVENGHAHVIVVLIDAGADVDAKNYLGQTPSHVAASLNQIDCIRLLGSPQALANLTLKDAKGRTPCDTATATGHQECAAVIAQLALDDKALHMKQRMVKELRRQRHVVKQKEVMFGRSMFQLEGGHEFQIPASAHLDRESSVEVATSLRASTSAPYYTLHGIRAARDHDAAMGSALARGSLDLGGTLRDLKAATDNASAAADFGGSSVERGGQVDVDGVDIPGRISTTRWIDVSEGRPRDLGYDSCI